MKLRLSEIKLVTKTMFSFDSKVYDFLSTKGMEFWDVSLPPLKLSAHLGWGVSISLFAYDCIPSAYNTA